MNKRELAQAVAARIDRPVSEVRECLEAILGTIMDAVVDGERVSLFGFGAFSRAWSPPRRGRHPRSGRLLEIHSRHWARFAAGATFSRRLKALTPLYDRDIEHIKARRVARTLADDLRLYHQPLIEAARRHGAPGEELATLLDSARARFRERVPEQVCSARDYFEEEVAALLRTRRPPEQPRRKDHGADAPMKPPVGHQELGEAGAHPAPGPVAPG